MPNSHHDARAGRRRTEGTAVAGPGGAGMAPAFAQPHLAGGYDAELVRHQTSWGAVLRFGHKGSTQPGRHPPSAMAHQYREDGSESHSHSAAKRQPGPALIWIVSLEWKGE